MTNRTSKHMKRLIQDDNWHRSTIKILNFKLSLVLQIGLFLLYNKAVRKQNDPAHKKVFFQGAEIFSDEVPTTT